MTNLNQYFTLMQNSQIAWIPIEMNGFQKLANNGKSDRTLT